jgi:hypothetical protein
VVALLISSLLVGSATGLTIAYLSGNIPSDPTGETRFAPASNDRAMVARGRRSHGQRHRQETRR